MYASQLMREEDRRHDHEHSYCRSMGAAIAAFIMGGLLFGNSIGTRIQQGLGFSSPFLLTLGVLAVAFLGPWLLITDIVIRTRVHRRRNRERRSLIQQWAAEELAVRSQGLTYGDPFPYWWRRLLTPEVRRGLVR
jgi:hypothetical protein